MRIGTLFASRTQSMKNNGLFFFCLKKLIHRPFACFQPAKKETFCNPLFRPFVPGCPVLTVPGCHGIFAVQNPNPGTRALFSRDSEQVLIFIKFINELAFFCQFLSILISRGAIS